MTPERNLGRFVSEAPACATASAGELGAAPLPSSEICADARALGSALRNAGAVANEPVVILISNQPQDIVGFVGLWLAECVVVPIHVASPEPVLRGLIARVGARFAVRAGKLERLADAVPPERPLLEGAALIVFTSGSTGQPKGVVVPHGALIWKLQVLSRLLCLTPDDIVVVPLQLTFIFGIWSSLLTLLSGARLLLAPKFSAATLAVSCATVLAAVPTLLRTLSADAAIDAPHLRSLLTGGEPFGPALAEKLKQLLPHTGVYDLFGLTETGSCDFCVGPNDQPAALGTIGHATEGVEYRIVELPELGLPSGVGELQIHTPALMSGYLDDPVQTAAALADDFFRTGDLATVRSDGYVQLVGRSKDVVSRGGNKIAPLEIENFFARHEGVSAVLAFGMPDERLGECLHLMVVPCDPAPDEAELRAWAKDRLERFKTPDVFHFVASLPAGRTGKADRAAARILLSERSA